MLLTALRAPLVVFGGVAGIPFSPSTLDPLSVTRLVILHSSGGGKHNAGRGTGIGFFSF